MTRLQKSAIKTFAVKIVGAGLGLSIGLSLISRPARAAGGDASFSAPLNQLAKDLALQTSVAQGDASAVRHSLDQGANPNSRDEGQDTALMRAAANGNADVVKVLLDNGADPKLKGPFGYTALMEAAIFGRADKTMVDLLISHGADVNARMDRGDGSGEETALMFAAGTNPYPEVLPALVGSSVDAVNQYGKTALMFAAESWVDVKPGEQSHTNPNVQELLLLGADPNRVDSRGWTALMQASLNGSLDLVKLLMNAGSGADDEAALQLAQRRFLADDPVCAKNYDEIIKLLKQKLGLTPAP